METTTELIPGSIVVFACGSGHAVGTYSGDHDECGTEYETVVLNDVMTFTEQDYLDRQYPGYEVLLSNHVPDHPFLADEYKHLQQQAASMRLQQAEDAYRSAQAEHRRWFGVSED